MRVLSPVLPERINAHARALSLASDSRVVAIASLLVVAATRIWTWSDALFAWDSVNFALAIHDIDVEAHQPHPPGYLGVVLLARAFMWVGSENHALLTVVGLASACTAWFSWRLSIAITGSLSAAWTTWAIVTFSPLHWFYGAVAEVYAAELAVVTAIAFAAHRVRAQAPGARVALGLAVLVGSLVKIPVIVLMLPLIAYVCLGLERHERWRTAVMVAAALALGVGTLAIIEPLDVIFSTSTGQVGEVAGSAFLSSLNPRALNRSTRDMAYALVAAVGPGLLAAVAFGRASRRRESVLLAMWCVPFLLTCAFVHFPKPGYLLPLLPPLALFASARLTGASPVRTVAGIAVIVSASILQFAVLQPFSSQEIGEGLRYADKTLGQQVRTEVNSVLRPSRAAIASLDEQLATLLDRVERHCAGTKPLRLVEAGGALTWRHVMFYLPAATTVQEPSSRAPLLLGAARRQVRRSSSKTMQGECVVRLRGARTTPLQRADGALPAAAVVAIGTQSIELHTEPATLAITESGEMLPR